MRYWLYILIFTLMATVSFVYAQTNVTATVDTVNRTTSMSNGILSITINNKGQVNALIYKGKDLVNASKGGRFYLSYNDQNGYHELSPDKVHIQKQTDNYAEVVYTKSNGNLILSQGFIMLKNVSGLYGYVIVKGTVTPVNLQEMRIVYRVDPNSFDYSYVTNRR
ncbi:hypothetical protein [Microbacter margulisiae]|uniref:Flp pilus assembly protein TadG n=1 Tax=Microbacter margulisiae TaxID=1350067 RepID=A0A7W5DRY3_9PORP|nr:hypothetical protein [Microbacter margulisiae]MBB3187972.1 Flp pilus assembly protein TadG [Microbacter margulisiae]